MPADVIKTKILSGEHGTSLQACVRGTLAGEGVGGFYRKFWDF